MTNTNEDIARAAGLNWPLLLIASTQGSETLKIEPDWRSDPAAVATWLLPVLERRWPDMTTDRFTLSKPDDEIVSAWGIKSTRKRPRHVILTRTWHQAVINGILATREDK